MNFNPADLLSMLLRQRPGLANNPQTQGYLHTIQSNDAQRGQQIADNICSSMGLTREQAIEKARQFFNL